MFINQRYFSDSQVLNELHKQFYIFLSNVDVKIVTFGEAKTTRTLGVDIHIVPPEFSRMLKNFDKITFQQKCINIIETIKVGFLSQDTCNSNDFTKIIT